MANKELEVNEDELQIVENLHMAIKRANREFSVAVTMCFASHGIKGVRLVSFGDGKLIYAEREVKKPDADT